MSSAPSQNFAKPAVVPENAWSMRTPRVPLTKSTAAVSVMGKTVLDPSMVIGVSLSAVVWEQATESESVARTSARDKKAMNRTLPPACVSRVANR